MNHWHCGICDKGHPEEAEHCLDCYELAADGPRLTREGAYLWLREKLIAVAKDPHAETNEGVPIGPHGVEEIERVLRETVRS